MPRKKKKTTSTQTSRKTSRKKTKKSRKKKGYEPVDICTVLDRDNARELRRLVARLRSPVEVCPAQIPHDRCTELARAWGIASRADDCERYNGEPDCGECWEWEPRASDHWFEFLVITESARPESDQLLIEACLREFRTAYFALASKVVAMDPRMAVRRPVRGSAATKNRRVAMAPGDAADPHPSQRLLWDAPEPVTS